MARQIKCSICGTPVPPRQGNASFPFCCARCRWVDLGKWLGEEYRVPESEPSDREDETRPIPGGEEPVDS